MISLKKIYKILFGLILGGFAALLLLLALFQHPGFKNAAINFLVEHYEKKTGWKIKIDNIDGLLPLQVRGHQLELASPENHLVKIEQFHLVFSPLDLIKGYLSLHLAEIKNIEVSYPKISNGTEKENKEGGLFQVPFLPIHVKVGHFEIEDLKVNGVQYPQKLQGSFKSHPRKKLLVASLKVIDPKIPTMEASLKLRQHKKNLEGNLKFNSFVKQIERDVALEGQFVIEDNNIFNLEKLHVDLNKDNRSDITVKGSAKINNDLTIKNSLFHCTC